MPPSGFSQEAINGLLTFVSDTYRNTLDKYKGQDMSEETVLNASIKYLNGLVEKAVPISLDETISKEGLKGLQKFVADVSLCVDLPLACADCTGLFDCCQGGHGCGTTCFKRHCRFFRHRNQFIGIPLGFVVGVRRLAFNHRDI